LEEKQGKKAGSNILVTANTSNYTEGVRNDRRTSNHPY